MVKQNISLPTTPMSTIFDEGTLSGNIETTIEGAFGATLIRNLVGILAQEREFLVQCISQFNFDPSVFEPVSRFTCIRDIEYTQLLIAEEAKKRKSPPTNDQEHNELLQELYKTPEWIYWSEYMAEREKSYDIGPCYIARCNAEEVRIVYPTSYVLGLSDKSEDTKKFLTKNAPKVTKGTSNLFVVSSDIDNNIKLAKVFVNLIRTYYQMWIPNFTTRFETLFDPNWCPENGSTGHFIEEIFLAHYKEFQYMLRAAIAQTNLECYLKTTNITTVIEKYHLSGVKFVCFTTDDDNIFFVACGNMNRVRTLGRADRNPSAVERYIKYDPEEQNDTDKPEENHEAVMVGGDESDKMDLLENPQ